MGERFRKKDTVVMWVIRCGVEKVGKEVCKFRLDEGTDVYDTRINTRNYKEKKEGEGSLVDVLTQIRRYTNGKKDSTGSPKEATGSDGAQVASALLLSPN